MGNWAPHGLRAAVGALFLDDLSKLGAVLAADRLALAGDAKTEIFGRAILSLDQPVKAGVKVVGINHGLDGAFYDVSHVLVVQHRSEGRLDPADHLFPLILRYNQVVRMGYGRDKVGVVEAWSIIQNTCQNYFEPDLSKSLCSGGLSVLHQQHSWRVYLVNEQGGDRYLPFKSLRTRKGHWDITAN